MSRTNLIGIALIFLVLSIVVLMPDSTHQAFDLVAYAPGVPGQRVAPAVQNQELAAAKASTAYSFNWASTRSSPEGWDGNAEGGNWDVIVHSMKQGPGDAVAPMQAQHGADCAAPPATHPVNDVAGSVFVCRNHLMTAIKAPLDEAAAIYLTAPRLVDFSAGPATVSFKVSTQSASVYDWLDLWLTPFESNLVVPLGGSAEDVIDGQGPPRQAVQVRQAHGNNIQGDTYYEANEWRDFQPTNLGVYSRPPFVEDLLAAGPSAATRMTFQLTISESHVRFGMPAQPGLNLPDGQIGGIWWVDNDFSRPLGWNQAVFQIGHHSYSPDKFGDYAVPLSLLPDTWHWSDFQISSTVPFKIEPATPRVVGNNGQPASARLASPPIAGSRLRFTAIGSDLEISFDGGLSWQLPQHPLQSVDYAQPNVFYDNYWTPLPVGATTVQFRAADPQFPGGLWTVRDISVWTR
jgi:hypothetical protein